MLYIRFTMITIQQPKELIVKLSLPHKSISLISSLEKNQERILSRRLCCYCNPIFQADARFNTFRQKKNKNVQKFLFCNPCEILKLLFCVVVKIEILMVLIISLYFIVSIKQIKKLFIVCWCVNSIKRIFFIVAFNLISRVS